MCFFVAVLLAASSRAATFIPPGPLLGTQIWTAASSPYVIEGDVTVGMSGRLFIEAGTEVQFASTDSAAAGVDTNRCELRVLSGLLVVRGTKTQPVVFRALSNSLPSAWYGITVTNGLGAFITNAWIQDADRGFSSDNTNLCVLDHVTLCSNRTGAHIGRVNTNSPVALQSLRVFQNTNGLVLVSFAPALLRSSAIYNNFTHGIFATHAAIINCTIQGNGYGVRCFGGFDDQLRLLNCLFTSNSFAIFQAEEAQGTFFPSAHIETVHCAYWGNGIKLFQQPPAGSTIGTNAVLGDPRYLNLPGADGIIGTADDDFRLAAGSACIDHGDNNFVLNGPFTDLNDGPRLIDDPAASDAAAYFNFSPVVDIGACEFQPPLQILSIRKSGSDVDIVFPTVPGRSYQSRYSHDFAGWTNFGPEVMGDGTIRTQRDANAGSPFRFYHIQEAP
jgi:hypothetical protein